MTGGRRVYPILPDGSMQVRLLLVRSPLSAAGPASLFAMDLAGDGYAVPFPIWPARHGGAAG